MFNSPKEELVQALLNTCSVSNEAKEYLKSLLSNGNVSNENLKIHEIKYNKETHLSELTLKEVIELINDGYILFIPYEDKSRGYFFTALLYHIEIDKTYIHFGFPVQFSIVTRELNDYFEVYVE